MACEVEAYDQLARLTEVIEHRLARRVRPGLALRWIVPTRYEARRGLDREVVELLNENHPDLVTSPVREAVAVRDAYTAGMPVSVYDPPIQDRGRLRGRPGPDDPPQHRRVTHYA